MSGFELHWAVISGHKSRIAFFRERRGYLQHVGRFVRHITLDLRDQRTVIGLCMAFQKEMAPSTSLYF